MPSDAILELDPDSLLPSLCKQQTIAAAPHVKRSGWWSHSHIPCRLFGRKTWSCGMLLIITSCQELVSLVKEPHGWPALCVWRSCGRLFEVPLCDIIIPLAFMFSICFIIVLLRFLPSLSHPLLKQGLGISV